MTQDAGSRDRLQEDCSQHARRVLRCSTPTIELLAGRGFSWAALMLRPYDELAALDRYQPLLEHFGPLA